MCALTLTVIGTISGQALPAQSVQAAETGFLTTNLDPGINSTLAPALGRGDLNDRHLRGYTQVAERAPADSSDESFHSVQVKARAGRHAGHDRLVFDWPVPVEPDVVKNDDQLIITFNRSSAIELPPSSTFTWRSETWPQVIFGLVVDDDGQEVRAKVDPGTELRTHSSNDGRRLVVDIVHPALDDLEVIAADTGDKPRQDGDEPESSKNELPEPHEVAEEGETKVGGFQVLFGGEVQFGVTTAEDEILSDGEGDRGYTFSTDAEIFIDAEIYPTEEVEIGANVFLDAAVDQISDVELSEAYLEMFSGLGLIELGRTDGAEDAMALGADTIAAGTGGIDGDTPNLGRTQIVTSDSAAKISYFTPRIGGVQFGLSFTPDTGDDEGRRNDDEESEDLNDHFGAGLNFVRRFGRADVALGAVGSFGNSELADRDDLNAFSVGGTLAWGDVEMGASYGNNDDSDEFDFATLGATVGFGEARAGIGYNYVDVKSDGITHVIVLGGDVIILEGVALQSDVSYAAPDEGDGNIASAFAVEFSF